MTTRKDTGMDVESKKVEQNDPKGPVLKSRKPDLIAGGTHLISVWQPTVIVDSHMHIQSGRCAPLQYVQSLTAFTSVMSRKWIEDSGMVAGRIVECLFEPFVAPRCYVLLSAMKTEILCPADWQGECRNAPQNSPVRFAL